MKILFIGGTGRLSSDIANLSVEKGNEVYLLTRGSSNRKKFINPKYNMIYADIHNFEQCNDKLYGLKFDVIIDFLTYNVEQLENTLKIIEGHYKQYVFVSTATVYEKKYEEEIITEDETKKGNKKWEYAYKKFLCEEKLKDYFNDSSEIYYTILRPYVTYNKTRIPYPIIPQDNGMEYSLIERIKKGKTIPMINNGMIETTITYTEDFAKGVVGLFGNNDAYNNDFHITSEENVMWKDVIEILAEHYKVKLNKKNFTIEQFSKLYPEFKEILEGDKGNKMKFDNSKIRTILPKFECKINLNNGLKKVVDFYENNPEFKKVDYYWDGYIDRICNEKIDLNIKSFKSKITYFLGYYKIPKIFYKIAKKIKIAR